MPFKTTFIPLSNLSGVFIIIVTPSRIAQYSYDRAAELASTEFGWLLLVAALSTYGKPGRTTTLRFYCSYYLVPSSRGAHVYYHPLWICVWYEGLLCRCLWLPGWISHFVFPSAISFQGETTSLVR